MEEKKNSRTRKTIILSLCVITIVFACILGTYAYFMVNISNNNRQEVQLDTGTMRLRFVDGNPTINQNIMLGETKTKKFTIENTGDLDASLSIEWLELVNTYTEGSLTYTLEQSETLDSGYTEIISKTNVPTTDTAFTTTLAPDLEIPTGKTYYYNLKITLNDISNVNQSKDINAKLTTKFTVSEPSSNRNYSLIIDSNGGLLDEGNIQKTFSLKSGEVKEIGIPRKAGVSFKNWKVVGYDSIVEGNTFTMGRSNTKIVAEWKAIEVKNIIDKLGITVKETTDTVPNFADPATTDEGVYSMEDDYGTSYFYRGAVTNNYVKFAGFYWRIIRVNGDGSVRIRYDGTNAYANGTNTADRFTHVSKEYNASLSNAKYVGWMYGSKSGSKDEAQTNEVNSNAKTLVDAWYKTNIEDKGYGKYIADAIFCNDRSIYQGLGYGSNSTKYGGYKRIFGLFRPNFKCSQKNDAFTVEDTAKGNGALTYPVGLITMDEIMAAGGGKYNITNTSYYLYNSISSWTMTPSELYTGEWPALFKTSSSIKSESCHNSYSLAPVINLSFDYFLSLIGDGSMENPFRTE